MTLTAWSAGVLTACSNAGHSPALVILLMRAEVSDEMSGLRWWARDRYEPHLPFCDIYGRWHIRQLHCTRASLVLTRLITKVNVFVAAHRFI
jgi:hypothetical protein